jgi:hypothetical protein
MHIQKSATTNTFMCLQFGRNFQPEQNVQAACAGLNAISAASLATVTTSTTPVMITVTCSTAKQHH